MGGQITNVTPMEPAEAGPVLWAAQPAMLNRAAWPTGSLLAFTIASHHAIPPVACGPKAEIKPDGASVAA